MFRLNVTIQLLSRVETMRLRGAVVAFLTENNYSFPPLPPSPPPPSSSFLASSLHRTRKVERPNSREQADPVSHGSSSIMSINRTDTRRRVSTSKRLAKIGRHIGSFEKTWLITRGSR